jgi:hypothetical protein
VNVNDSPVAGGSPVARAPLPEGGESFEALAIKQGLITSQQLQEAYLVQRRYEEDGLAYDIDEILVKKGIITQTQVAGVWARHAQEGRNTIEGYEILAKLGEGGMGAVYKARQISMDRIVALKVLLRRHLKGEQGVERFLREARAVARLSHPHIVMGLDAGYSN